MASHRKVKKGIIKHVMKMHNIYASDRKIFGSENLSYRYFNLRKSTSLYKLRRRVNVVNLGGIRIRMTKKKNAPSHEVHFYWKKVTISSAIHGANQYYK